MLNTRLSYTILIPILSFAAAAQVPPPDRALASNWESVKMLAPGTQIRVAADASKPGAPQQMRGELVSVSDSEFVIKQGAGTQSFPRAGIVSVSVQKKGHRRRNALVGLGVGSAAGALIGFGIGHAYASNCKKAGGGFCGLDQGVGAGIGGIGGLIGGTLIGAILPMGWREVYRR